MSSYSSREYGRGSSPEPPRKRVRADSPSYIGGRRSHDRTFSASGGADYPSSRVGGGSSGFYDKGNSGGGALGGGYLSEKGTYREVRESRPPHHAPPSSNDYPTFRKPSFSSPRGGGGGFRASRRGLRTSRGAGAAFRHSSSASYLSRKRLLADSAYHLRRRGLTTRTSYLRRLKQYRLLKSRYSGRVSERKKRESEDNQDGDEEDDKDAEEGDEEEDEEIIEVESSEEGEEEEEEEDDEDEEEEEEGEEKKAPEGGESKELETSKEPVEVEEGEVEGGEDDGIEKGAVEGTGEDGEDKENKEKDGKDSSKDGPVTPKKVVKKKKKIAVKKSQKKSKTAAASSESKETKKTEDGKEESGGEEKEGSEKKPTLTNFLGQPYIKLKCPHCHFACVTFKEYSRHLGSTKHLAAMSTLSAKLRKTFATMRLEQRKMQKVLDEEAKSLNMRLRTVFCNVCKLNYRTLKSQHQNSASHKKMREFQAPYCRVCRVGYKSSWAYEVHLCELQHIKRKARLERLSNPPGAKDLDEDINLDTNNFMVLDAVGSGDDSEGEKSENEAAEEKADDIKEKIKDGSKEKKKKEKKEIKLGSEYCKLMEVYFCELCKIYLPRLDDKERALTVHCRSRTHLQRYIRSRDDRNLRRKAVKLHKEREKLREKEKKSSNKDESSAKEETEDNAAAKTDIKDEDKTISEAVVKKEAEDKSWSAEEEDGMKHLDDDDDEESKEGERYDRFKHSDKEVGANNTGNTNANDEASPESPADEKQTVTKGKSGSVTKDSSAVTAETTANGNITSAEKKKIEAVE
uniref:Putative apoptosis antagonizing transcription factor/protein transport protein n=1 Tax=Panstrongylus megistus TaxID=65343 RepID=A0A069DXG9_9HEMI